MSIPSPPDPVTLGYIGVCAGLAGGLVRAAYASLPATWRKGKTTVTLFAALTGGLYGAVIWVVGLLGVLDVPAQAAPTNGDVLGVTVGVGGIGGVIGALAGLSARHMLKRDIAPEDWTERIAGMGILAGFALSALIPGLDS
jgi:hypothetical protein